MIPLNESPPWVIGFFTAIALLLFYIFKSLFKKGKKEILGNKFEENRNPYNLSENELYAYQKNDGSKEYLLAFLEVILREDKLKYEKVYSEDFMKIYNSYVKNYGDDNLLNSKLERFKKINNYLNIKLNHNDTKKDF